MTFVLLWIRYRRCINVPQQDDLLSTIARARISYYELLRATDALSESNLIGSGSFGSVYKGILRSGTAIAVKAFNLQLDAAFKSFDTECEVLCSIHHRNLVKVITSCSNLDFKASVLEYLPNRSLEKYLYSHNYFLNVKQRLSIMIDVACALEYLHHECSSVVVHYDLKPSNALLDEDMVAHLSDFGILKLLGDDESDLYTETFATLGYITPVTLWPRRFLSSLSLVKIASKKKKCRKEETRAKKVGSIPFTIINISRIELIAFTGNSLSGDLPNGLCKGLPILKGLYLSINKLRGHMPTSLSNCSQLQILSLSENEFDEPIHSAIGNLSNLQILGLGTNHFSGIIPQEIGNLVNLMELWMEENQMTGSVPISIFNISVLQVLSLSRNNLNGFLAREIGNLTKMQRLQISGNKLIGKMTNKSQMMDAIMSVGVSNIVTSSRTNAPQQWHRRRSPKNFRALTSSGGSKRCSFTSPLYVCNGSLVKTLLRNYILGGLQDDLYNIYSGTKTSKKLWGELERKYKMEDAGIKKFLVARFLDIKMIDSKSVVSQVQELPVIIHDLLAEDFKNYLKNKRKEITVEDLTVRLRIEENNKTTKRRSKGNSTINGAHIVEDDQNNFKKWKKAEQESNQPKKKFKGKYFNCGKIGHKSTDCRAPKKGKKKDQANMIESNKECGNLCAIFSECNLMGNPREWLMDSGATGHVEGTRKICLQMTSGKVLTLNNVLNLTLLVISFNPLNGVLPASMGNLSTSLRTFVASSCKILAQIPNEVGNLSSLLFLYLSGNNLVGSIPTSIGNLRNLQRFDLTNNKLTGFMEIIYIHLGSNELSSNIPPSLGNLQDLVVLDLSSNNMVGSLPSEIGNLKVATLIDLAVNQLSNETPRGIGGLQTLAHLYLRHNKLEGAIPDSMSNMVGLEFLHLSYNNISRIIPKSLEKLQNLKYFNVSFNKLNGEIPSGGPFKNFPSQFFIYNEALCGSSRFSVPPCPTPSKHRSTRKKVLLLFLLLGIALVFVPSIFVFLWIRYRRGKRAPQQPDSLSSITRERISYYELLQATEALSESNLIGSGSFGSVYKGVLRSATAIAVKVFNLQLDAAFKTFDTECEALRSLRHRNLVKVITSCSNLDFKALVLQYMPNGSLEKYLYSHNYFLDILQRLSSMIDVACALEYLHHGCSSPVIHCDLKPSNVLLDEDMVSHLSDFGISKLLGENESDLYTKTFATLGYIAPVSTKCDVYSYGIMLLETFTRRRPNEFEGDLSLKQWVSYSLPEAVMDVVDVNLVKSMGNRFQKELDLVASIMKVALDCCAESPSGRTNMKDIVGMLQMMKIQLLAF
ncbi:hypothetical protein CQW23_33172 [Capsicum baccatum]|uniref:non-specific serine/threonine protein kinase n=1 Tax=Capsicum baccatum TaxID=33114 RepID=A0A2G2V2P2_CAPBA|nr:hypothetical protein CQW23_33172 [Capsicum baccatum]